MKKVDPIRSKKEILDMKVHFLKEQNVRNYLMFALGINSALRISDLLSIQVDEVRKENGEIRERLDLREGKTNKEKKYKISYNAEQALKFYFKYINSERYFGHEEIQPDDYLFASQDYPHTSIDRTWAWRKIKDTAQAVGISERISPHSLRKTWGYMARTESDLPISIIMEKLNHADEQTTLSYIGIIQEEVEEAEEKVSL